MNPEPPSRRDDDPRDPDLTADTPPPSDEMDDEEFLEKYIQIEGYKLVREITRGGQAIILQAIQKSTGRRVAIKVLREGPWGTARSRSRLEREVQIMAALDHPNIVSIIDRGETPAGWIYFVLEYVEGKTLSEYIDDYWEQQGRPAKPSDYRELLQLFVRIANAIHAAHLRGIVHRDIKPSNILIDAHHEPHILDFGVARPGFVFEDGEQGRTVTQAGEFLGSLQWASPEQAEGQWSNIDIRSDIYSLGVILYELLTGEFPYDVFGQVREVLNNIVHARPDAPQEVLRKQAVAKATENEEPLSRQWRNPIDPALGAIVMRALEKNPDNRYQTAGALAKDLKRYLAGEETEAKETPPPATSTTPLIVAPGAILLLAGALALGLFSAREAAPPGEEPTPPRVARVPGVQAIGVRIENGAVRFTFDPARFSTCRLADGRIGNVNEIGPIRRVAVAGEFNAWQPDAGGWSLDRTGPNRFELRKPLDAFQEQTFWRFKFVVNGNIWVGAPPEADNREIVLDDTATYNLVLEHPDAGDREEAEALRAYRTRIERAYPGQGQNLSIDAEGHYHFVLNGVDPGFPMPDLSPFVGIPLKSLNIWLAHTQDLRPLRHLRTLDRLVCSEDTVRGLIGGVQELLHVRDFEAARQLALERKDYFEDVPALTAFWELMLKGIANMRALESRPGALPPHTLAFQGRAYALVPYAMTWPQARVYAAHRNGHLATIAGEAEQNWFHAALVQPAMGISLWLGGTDQQQEGRWTWVSGEPWSYQRWSYPEPNNGYGNEHAAAIRNDGYWYDYNGQETALPFVIEWNNPPGPAPEGAGNSNR